MCISRPLRTIHLGLGSNLGHRCANLGEALERLECSAVVVSCVSSVYETAPVGPVQDQPAFLNAVAELRTSLTPRALLAHCLEVERFLGRKRTVPKGPRTIDLDLLLAEELVASWPTLVLPHPALTERAFVLIPLLELAPELCDPRDGRPLATHLAPLARSQAVARVAGPEALWPPMRRAVAGRS